jgi:hypothetical protein
VGGETDGFAGPLHLDQAAARPDQVQELAVLRLLEPRARFDAIGSVAGEQLVEERLCLGALAAAVEAPPKGEIDGAPPDLVARHGRGR